MLASGSSEPDPAVGAPGEQGTGQPPQTSARGGAGRRGPLDPPLRESDRVLVLVVQRAGAVLARAVALVDVDPELVAVRVDGRGEGLDPGGEDARVRLQRAVPIAETRLPAVLGRGQHHQRGGPEVGVHGCAHVDVDVLVAGGGDARGLVEPGDVAQDRLVHGAVVVVPRVPAHRPGGDDGPSQPAWGIGGWGESGGG